MASNAEPPSQPTPKKSIEGFAGAPGSSAGLNPGSVLPSSLPSPPLSAGRCSLYGKSALSGLRASDLDRRRLRPALLSSSSDVRTVGAPSELHALISSVPSTHQFDHGGSRDAAWRSVLFRAQSHGPQEAPMLDRRGRTALHAACAVRPPLHVVEALLEACGEESVAVRDKHGRTALAVAIAGGARLPVCKLLLRSCQRSAFLADRAGMLPLHLACGTTSELDVLYADSECPRDAPEKLIQLLLKANPGSASTECDCGRTPLHVAVESLADFRVIQALLKACPNAVCLDGCGSTPLAIAIRYNSSSKIIKALVEANPFAARKLDTVSKLYPVHHAIQHNRAANIIEILADTGGPSLVALKDDLGQTALHMALEKVFFGGGRNAWLVARALLNRDSRLAKVRNRVGMNPLDLACRHYCRALLREPFGGAASVEREWEIETREASHHAWEMIVFLLSAEKQGQMLLHAAVRAGCPEEVVKKALQCYPHEAKEFDDEGQLPLHLVLRKNPPHGKSAAGSCIVNMFLDAHPAAVAIPNPADGNRLPLHAAARCGWLEPDTLQRLLQAFPEALQTLDPVTELYPFQLAAVHDAKENREGLAMPPMFMYWGFEENWEMLQINSIFDLLRAAPEQLACALHHS